MARQWSSRQCNCGLGRDEPPTAGHNARLHTFGTDGTEWKQGCTRLAAGESKCMWVSWLCATRLKHIGQAVRPQARAGSTAHICPLCARYQSKRACAQCSHRHPTAAQDRKWRTQVTHRCKYSGTCCFKIRRAVFNPSDLFVSSREPNDGMRTGSSTGTEGDGVGAAAAMAACAACQAACEAANFCNGPCDHFTRVHDTSLCWFFFC
jgi:hypothetical protein